MKKYHIYAYKHYWPEGGIDEYDIPIPYEKERREYVIEARSESEALKLAGDEYGSRQHIDRDGNYLKNSDGSWTLMGVTKVEIAACSK